MALGSEIPTNSDFIVHDFFAEDGSLYDLEFFTVGQVATTRIKELYEDYFWGPLARELHITPTDVTSLEYQGTLVGLRACINRIRTTNRIDDTAEDLPSNYIAYLFESTAAVVDKEDNPDTYTKRAIIYKINELSFMVKPLTPH